MVDNTSFLSNIKAYRDIRPKYEVFCKRLVEICRIMIKEFISEDEFIIQTRVKSITSFADKISRPNSNYSNPLDEITDLCGLRIILGNLDQVKTVFQLLSDNFFIDVEDEEENDIKEFSSPSNHFIVQVLPESDYKKRYKTFDVKIDEEFLNLKAEIQIRTILQHGWAINQYDEVFGKQFKIPEQYIRELNQSATLLEIADTSLTEIYNKLSDYDSNFSTYMTRKQILKEIERLEVILGINNRDIDLSYRIAEMAMVMEDWDKVIDILESLFVLEEWDNLPSIKSAVIQKVLGLAFYKKYKKDYITYISSQGKTKKDYEDSIEGFKKANLYLLASIDINPNDSDAFASLGGYWKDIDNDKALKYYENALEIDPDDPYSLGNYIILKIQRNMRKNKKNILKIIDTKRGAIQKGIEKRIRQIKLNIEIPWAFFDVGLFHLYLGNIHEALLYYLNGIRFSQEIWMIETTLKTLNGIKSIQNQLIGLRRARMILILALYARKIIEKKDIEDFQEYIDGLREEGLEEPIKLQNPIVIVAGGTAKRIEKHIDKYKDMLINAFKNFEGTLISGGTPFGIARIVGDIQVSYPNRIKTIGYIPENNPDGISVDERYSLIRIAKRNFFSIFENCQTWFDILSSGIQTNQIKLIGINGGKISALEFRLAIALGAQVGILKDSGRAATELINDSSWMQQINPKQKPVRLFKVINKNEDDVYNFLTKQFVIDPDIDNLRLFLIINRGKSLTVYEKGFISLDLSQGLLGSLLGALDLFADEIKLGAIASVNSENGCITGGFLNNNEFKIVFILFKKPSKSLERKIAEIIKKIDQEISDELTENAQTGRIYSNHKKISEIFTDVFGQEIKKFFKEN